jgi:mRNA-degrading endonuclease RelE of RelBE toxin-antitoxin system
MYTVMMKKEMLRRLEKLPEREQILFQLLCRDLEKEGPIRKNWPNFSSLGSIKYHCHLSRKYVACWTWVKGALEMEVYYVGTREKAPY